LPALQTGLARYASLQRDVARLMAEVVRDGRPDQVEALRKERETLRAAEVDLEAALEAARKAKPGR
jgi:hypothetical protein